MLDLMFSKHARMRMVERGISAKEVNEAVNKGSKRRRDREIISAYKHIVVVFRVVNRKYYVITVMSRW